MSGLFIKYFLLVPLFILKTNLILMNNWGVTRLSRGLPGVFATRRSWLPSIIDISYNHRLGVLTSQCIHLQGVLTPLEYSSNGESHSTPQCFYCRKVETPQWFNRGKNRLYGVFITTESQIWIPSVLTTRESRHPGVFISMESRLLGVFTTRGAAFIVLSCFKGLPWSLKEQSF